MLLECSGYAAHMPSMGLSVHDGGPGPTAPNNLWRLISEKALECSDTTALEVFHQPSDHLSNLVPSSQATQPGNRLRWTYSQLLSAVEATARYLHHCGCRKNDVLATFVDNSVEGVVLLLSCLRLGVIYTPHDPTMLNRRDELQAILEAVKPKAVLVFNGMDAAKFKSQSQSWPCTVQLACQNDEVELPESWQLLSKIEAPKDVSVPPLESQPLDVVFIPFSSSRTNQSKGCPHTIQSIVAQIAGHRAFYGSDWTSGDVRFVLTAKSFVSNCYLGCVNTLSAGGLLVVPDSDFGADSTLRAICQVEATHMMLVQSQVRALVSSPSLPEFRPKTLRFVNVSGDSVSNDLVEKAKIELQCRRVVLSWSMTEGGPIFGWQNDERIPLYNNVPMVGRPLPGSLAKVCSSVTKEPLQLGGIGNLHISSDSLINSYLGNDISSLYVEDGRAWFDTGDLAVMEEDGCVSVVGRSKDIINCSGWPLLPSIIEDYIKEYFGIESQAIGVPNPSTGEKPVAVIKVRRASADLKQELRQGLPRHQGSEYTLGAVYLLSELGLKDWPLGQTRKVSKEDLRSAILERFHSSKPINGYPFSMHDMGYLEEQLNHRF